MSSVLAFENLEVLQHDPARAGIFNPENNLQADIRPGLTAHYIVDALVDTNATANALSRVNLNNKQLLMVGAFVMANGKPIQPKEIYEPFPGASASNANSFRSLVAKINDSRYRGILKSEPWSDDKRTTVYTWGEPLYDSSLELEVEFAFWRRVGGTLPSLKQAETGEDSQGEKADFEFFQRNRNNPIELQEVITPDGVLDWRDKALCAQTDSEAFFPEKGGSTREAKKVCLTCDVRDDCLESALINEERFGIWGGLSERERRKLKKRAI